MKAQQTVRFKRRIISLIPRMISVAMPRHLELGQLVFEIGSP